MQALDDLLDYFAANGLGDTLNPPADEAAIAALEARFGHALPEAFKALYRRFDGQRRFDGPDSEDRFLPIAEMLTLHEHWQGYLRDHFGAQWHKLTPAENDSTRIADVLCHPGWLPFMSNGSDIACLDFAPAREGTPGQVITVYTDSDISQYIIDAENEDFETWIEDYLGVMNGDFEETLDDILEEFEEFEERFGGEEDGTSDEIRLYADEIEAHYEKWFGEIAMVYHEIVSDIVHVDIHMIPPADNRPWITLATTGMSDLAMNVDDFEGSESFRRAELLICLPPDWPIAQQDFENEDNYWPVRWLKMLARLPHEYDTWLGQGHTIPNGDPPERIANTPFAGCLLLPPLATRPEEACILHTHDGEIIRFYILIPLYEEEMDFKVANGVSQLLEHFDAARLSEVVDITRKSVLKKK